MKVGQGDAHSLFERGPAHVPAKFRRVSRLSGIEAERSETGNDLKNMRLLRNGGLHASRFRALLRRGPRLDRGESLVAHELGAECALRSILVMRPAPNPDPRHRGLAPTGELLDVIELEV